MKKPQLYPSVVSVSKIEVRGGNSLVEPYFKLRGVRQNNCIFNTSVEETKTLQIEKNQELTIKMRENIYFLGDVVLEIKQNNFLKKKFAASFAFNTAFLDPNESKLEIGMAELSPLSAVKSGIFQKDFQISLHFKRLCKCHENNNLNERCGRCAPYMNMNDVKGWE